MEIPVIQAANSLEPGEIPTQLDSAPPRVERPPIREEIREVDEEPSAADSDLGACSDEESFELSSSHATPVKNPRGQKSNKKQREERSYADILQDSQQSIKSMMNTRSKQGQDSKGATPSKSK